MAIISPNIDQAKLQTFESNFLLMAQQKDTKLLNTPAVKHMTVKGISNVSRMDKFELDDITDQGRNPLKTYTEMSNDNRKSFKKRFTKTLLVDDMDKAMNLITDPTSDLYTLMRYAKKRTCDRMLAYTAIAPIVCGEPDSVGTIISPEDDGVITIDGTSDFDYLNVVSKAITYFENNEIDPENITLALSANEKESLRNDDHYMSMLYSNQNTVDKGTITNASGFNVVSFAGSRTGVGTILSPILPEIDGKRQNLFLAPEALGFAMEVGRLDVSKSAKHVNSWEVTIDLWLKGMRLMGERVIRGTSTI